MERLQQTITELNDKLKNENKTPEELDEEFEQFYENAWWQLEGATFHRR